MKGNRATIIKDGHIINIEEDDLIIGDVILVQAGDLVPADIKLLESSGLEVDEFELTGEILPVNKTVDKDEDEKNLFMGSRITRGAGKGVIVAVGEQTEYGGVLRQAWEKDRRYEHRIFKSNYFLLVALLLPALVVNLLQSNNMIAIIGLYLLLAAAFILLQNEDFFKHLIISREIKKCESLNIKIRDENVFDTLNDIDILCFDKTGVLTTRHMDVKSIYYAKKTIIEDGSSREAGIPYLIKLACVLCNDVIYFEKIEQADSRDKALISFAQKNGMNIHDIFSKTKRIYDLPFDSENRYMACGFQLENEAQHYFAKGDPEAILKMCDSYFAENNINKMDSDLRLFVFSKIDEINRNGGTAIAIAYSKEIHDTAPENLIFLCMLQLENTLMEGATEIVGKLTSRGVRCIMLTGDRAETAGRISEKCGITQNASINLTGKMISRMALAEVARQAEYCSVFSRLLPSQKGLIIRMFQQRGHRLAMIGDGPNDGIGLKSADVGISFVENSSPIARRLSKILINNLDDLVKIFESGVRIKKEDKLLKIFRILTLAAMLAGIYGWTILHFWL